MFFISNLSNSDDFFFIKYLHDLNIQFQKTVVFPIFLGVYVMFKFFTLRFILCLYFILDLLNILIGYKNIIIYPYALNCVSKNILLLLRLHAILQVGNIMSMSYSVVPMKIWLSVASDTVIRASTTGGPSGHPMRQYCCAKK